MAEKQIIGDEQKLGRTPVSSPSSNPKGGAMQLTGERVNLNMNPVSSPSSNPSGGQVQLVGSDVKLNKTPVKGWGNAANLPMSPRANAQSKTSA